MAQPRVTATGVAKSGTCVITFGPPARGGVWTGVVAVPLSPSTAVWAITVNGITIGQAIGANGWGPVQYDQGDTLVLTSTSASLVATHTYQAVLVGRLDHVGAAPQSPMPLSQSTLNNITNITNYLPTNASQILTVRRLLKGLSTPVQAQATFPFKIGLIVWAPTTNTTPLYVGGSSVSVNSAVLDPGQGISFAIANANIIWALGKTGDYVSFFGE